MSLTTARDWFLRGGQGAHHQWNAFRLPALTSSVCTARRRVCETLGLWGLGALRDDAGLVVSELFTNAVVHTDSRRVACALWTMSGLLHLEVADEGLTGTSPIARPATSDAENGRGLLLVDELTEEWGVRHWEPRGRTVWARLACGGGLGAVAAGGAAI